MLPCVFFPSTHEIRANIEAMFPLPLESSSSLSTVHTVRGFSLLTDEIALEECPQYSTGQDSIIGFCREHSARLPLSNVSERSIKALEPIQSSLKSGACHLAKEATVVALAPFGETDYNAQVILVSGTCKTETDQAHYELLKAVIDQWNSSAHGSAAHGPLWSLATDGEGRRRRAIHRYCFSSAIAQDSPLYAHIGTLPLLNTCCGPFEETNDSDYKHLEKRLASALRKSSGILVAHTHIDPSLIQRHLGKLPGIASSALAALFDKSDHQNVPKAHRLLSLVYESSQLDKIAKAPEEQAYVLLGQFLHSYIQPFTDLSMSLSEQLTLLSKCGHLLFALYWINRSDFISGQLYYDIQSSIKNAYFCVAKTRVLNPESSFYLLQCGDDHLENRFGTVRTIKHGSSVDLLELSERVAIAQHVDQIYARHPEWHRAPYRLSATGSSGIDHTNPRSCTGDLQVRNVDFTTTWLHGREQALQALSKARIPFDFDTAVAAFPNKRVDLMRPFGDYVGLREDSLNTSNTSQSDSTPDCTQNPMSNVSSNCWDTSMRSNTDLAESGTDQGALSSRKGWMDVDGHLLHLQSITKVLFGKEGGHKSTDRLRRVCSYSKDPFWDSQFKFENTILGHDLLVGSPVLTFLRIQKGFAAALLRVSAIILGDGQHVQGVLDSHLAEHSVTIKGQILVLRQEDKNEWHWDTTWATSTSQDKHESKLPGIQCISKQAAIVQTKGFLVKPVKPELCERKEQAIWCFQHMQLQHLADELWQSVDKHISHVPWRLECDSFPYRCQNGKYNQLTHQPHTDKVLQGSHASYSATIQSPSQYLGSTTRFLATFVIAVSSVSICAHILLRIYWHSNTSSRTQVSKYL